VVIQHSSTANHITLNRRINKKFTATTWTVVQSWSVWMNSPINGNDIIEIIIQRLRTIITGYRNYNTGRYNVTVHDGHTKITFEYVVCESVKRWDEKNSECYEIVRCCWLDGGKQWARTWDWDDWVEGRFLLSFENKMKFETIPQWHLHKRRKLEIMIFRKHWGENFETCGKHLHITNNIENDNNFCDTESVTAVISSRRTVPDN